jgi:hypothetical protein
LTKCQVENSVKIGKCPLKCLCVKGVGWLHDLDEHGI